MLVIRKALWGLVLILVLVNVTLWSWHKGCDTGYALAMSNVVLGIETPEQYFIKKFDIHLPGRVQLNQEPRND